MFELGGPIEAAVVLEGGALVLDIALLVLDIVLLLFLTSCFSCS